MCRNLAQVKQLIDDENSCYPTFYQQVKGSSRIPSTNSWDTGRGAVDAVLFPHYHEEIRFAALSLNNRGLQSNYGSITIVFKDSMIVHRATVFEENPFNFCTRHNVVAGTEPPRGYRASWEHRDILGKAKLHAALSKSTAELGFAAILLKDTGNSADDDFIEVHIFGTFNRSAIELVAFRKPKKREDIQLYRSLTRRLNILGIKSEEYE